MPLHKEFSLISVETTEQFATYANIIDWIKVKYAKVYVSSARESDTETFHRFPWMKTSHILREPNEPVHIHFIQCSGPFIKASCFVSARRNVCRYIRYRWAYILWTLTPPFGLMRRAAISQTVTQEQKAGDD